MNASRLLCGASLPAGLGLTMILAACAGGTPAGVNCDLTTQVPTLTIGVTVSGAMEESDCTVDGDPGDVYRLTLTATTLFGTTIAADKISPQIFIQKNATTISDNADIVFESGKPTRVNALLPAGDYLVEIQSDQNLKGAYTITTKTLDGSGCGENSGYKTYTVTGLPIIGAIAAGDCLSPVGGIPGDGYFMKLTAGTAYSVAVASTLTNVHLEVSKDATVLAGSGQSSTTGNLTINYTPTVTGYYRVAVVSANGALASYTLIVKP